jgi:F-type H+-transporting ATPase subunit delta
VKTSANQIAQRYVSAFFDVTGDPTVRKSVEQDFVKITKALAASAEFADILNTPLLSREAQAKAIDAVLAKMDADTATRQFIGLLARQKRLPLLPDIIALYHRRAASARGEMQAELITASAVSPSDAKAVAEALGKVYGKKITLNVSENSELLGGAIVRIGSVQLDSSLSGKMRRLKIALQAA